MMRSIPERWIDGVAAELRRPVRVADDFDDRVMEVVRGMPRHRLGAWARAIRPRTVTISPLISGIAAALVLAVALSVGHVIGAARTASAISPRVDVATDHGGSTPSSKR